MVHCAWGLCSNNHKYNKATCKRPKPEYVGTRFIPWPKDPVRLTKWINACGTENLRKPTDITEAKKICSLHFVGGGGPTEQFPDPIPCVRSQAEMTSWMGTNKKRKLISYRGDGPSSNMEIDDEAMDEVVIDSENVSSQDEFKNDESLPIEQTCGAVEGAFHKQFTDASTQTNIAFDDIAWCSDADLMNKKSLRRFLTVEEITGASCKFYTGLTFMKLWYLFNVVKEKASRMTYWRGSDGDYDEKRRGHGRELSLWQEYLLCLVRLRRGLEIEQLAGMFAVSVTTTCRAFNTWISFLSAELAPYLLRWPNQEQIRLHRPPAFKHFPRTRAIIDCTEFYVQRPSLPSSQRKTWSSYKQHNTFKALVAITPTGYISFISRLWSGNVSDRRITMDCGFLDLVETNDDIMADRGFVIRDALALRGATLNIPPFTKGGRLSSAAVTKTRRIARSRIHVERAIGRLKCFRILDGVIPLSLRKRMDEIFLVCACLCNMDSPLVK